MQIQVCNVDNEGVNHFSQFISVKVKKSLRKSQAQFREKLRELRLRQNDSFLRKKTCVLLGTLPCLVTLLVFSHFD